MILARDGLAAKALAISMVNKGHEVGNSKLIHEQMPHDMPLSPI